MKSHSQERDPLIDCLMIAAELAEQKWEGTHILRTILSLLITANKPLTATELALVCFS